MKRSILILGTILVLSVLSPSPKAQQQEGGDLLTAVTKGDFLAVESLLARGADINAKDIKGRTGLMIAAAHGHEVIVKNFLAKGADVNAKDAYGMTALTYAALMAHIAIFSELMNKKGGIETEITGINIKTDKEVSAETKRDGGFMALVMAAYGRPTNASYQADLVRLILSKVDRTLVNDKLISQAGYFSDIRCHDSVTTMLGKGFSIELQNRLRNANGFANGLEYLNALTVFMGLVRIKESMDNSSYEIGIIDLWSAAERGDVKMLKALLDQGADINAKNACGGTALMTASHKPDTLLFLLEKRPDVNAKDNKGWTALIHAASAGNLASIRSLLANGADINSKNNEGKTALSIAKADSKKHPEVVKLLIDAGAKN